MKLGLKGSIDDEQFLNRVKYQPDILEIHTFEEDFFGKRRLLLEERIKECEEKGIEVLLHHPIKYNGELNNIMDSRYEYSRYYDLSTRIMASILTEYGIKGVIHLMYRGDVPKELTEEEYRKVRHRVKEYNRMSEGRFLWENSVKTANLKEGDLLARLVKELDLNVCFDISHMYQALNGDNEKLIGKMAKYKPNIKHYHIVDSYGKVHDSLELGKGTIDWNRVKKEINKDCTYIYEIELEEYSDCKEQMNSWRYIKNIK